MEGRGARKGTRRPHSAGTRGLGAAGRARRESFPQGRGGGSLSSPSLCHPKVPRRTGGARLGSCPNASRGRWPVPITGAFGVPAGLAHLGESTPLPADPHTLSMAVGGHPWPCFVPPSHRQSRPSFPRRAFCPWRVPAAIHPRGTGDSGRLRAPAGTPHISGYRGQGIEQGASLPLRPTSGTRNGNIPRFILSTFLQPAGSGGWRRSKHRGGARHSP